MKTRALVGWLLLPVVLVSCTVGPDYRAPVAEQIAPADWHWKPAEPGDAMPKGEWWRLFNDPVLNGLETNALAGNQNLRAAVARVDQARAAARITRSQFFPELSLDPSLNRERYSGNQPLPFPVRLRPVYLDTYNVPLDLSYEVDLWGRVRRSFESARSQAQATAADTENILLTLTADVAANYFLLRALDAETSAVSRTLQSREDTVRILQARFEAGTVPEIDVAQAKSDLGVTRADLADVQRQRAETLDALAVLCGQMASTFSVAESPLTGAPPAVPAGLPSSVLERRPDVAAAERTLASKNAEIGAARAAYFPVVRLTGQGGFLSGRASDLFTMDSLTFAYGPGVSLPLFTGGRTKAQVAQAGYAYQEALANYHQTALTAFKEVEDSLAEITLYAKQADAVVDALASAHRATELTRARYEAGALTELEVVISQRSELQLERQAAQIAGSRYAATTRLVKALGGGWDGVEKAK
jgi:multidrug efflux system outer membrane protein